MQITRTIKGVNSQGPTVADLKRLIDNVAGDVVVSINTHRTNEGPYNTNTWSVTLTEEDNA